MPDPRCPLVYVEGEESVIAVLRVIEIFDSLQGEGYWSGVPMTFVRLAGCNAPELGLGCLAWCDTSGSWDRLGGQDMTVEEVVSRVRLPRMCITGGEPLLQVDGVEALVTEAHRLGVRVHLETNGTVDCPCEFDWVAVSPKPPQYMITHGWNSRIDEVKLVVNAELDAAEVEGIAAAFPGAIVCVQPEEVGGTDDPRSRAFMEKAVAMVMDHPEWRLSLQIHKYLGIR